MRRSRVGFNLFVVLGLVVLGVALLGLAGVAGLVAGIGPHALQAEALSGQALVQETLREAAWRAALMGEDHGAEAVAPATVIAQRFSWDGTEAMSAAAPLVREAPQPVRGMLSADVMNVLPVEQLTLFSPSFAYPGATLANLGSASTRIAEAQAPAPVPPPAPAERTPATEQLAAATPPAAPAAATPSGAPAAAAPSGAPAAAATASDAAVHRHLAAKFDNVLNDAQITSIKKRLKLTPDQEQMWPAVEAALRKIAYKSAVAARRQPKTIEVADAGRQRSGLMAYIDPDSAEVQQLKYAAIPLIMRLNDEQRREVKSLAHVMGLGGVAAEF